MDTCNIAYLSHEEPDSRRALQTLRKLKHVLTVSDRDDFTCRGGIVRFYADQDRLALEINRGAAGRAKLQISSQLLDLARVPDLTSCRGAAP